MKQVAALVLLAAAMATAGASQEVGGSVEETIRLLESRCDGIRDASFSVSAESNDLGRTLDVTFLKGKGTRIHAALHLFDFGFPNWAAAMMLGARHVDYVFAPEALHVYAEQPGNGTSQLAWQALRMRYDDPAFKANDPFFQPLNTPIRMWMDDPLVLTQLDPRFFLSLEQGLKYEGRKTEKERSFHVLSSTPAKGDVASKSCMTEAYFQATRKEIWVDAAAGTVARIQIEATITYNREGRPPRLDKVTLRMEGAGSRKVSEKFSIPETVTCTLLDEWNNVRFGSGGVVKRFPRFTLNGGVSPDEILSPWEAGELHAEGPLMRAAEYETILRRDPKDAGALWSLAIVQNLPPMYGRVVTPTEGPLPTLRKLAELKPDAEGPIINLVRLGADVAPILRREKKSSALVLALAESLNDKGAAVALSVLDPEATGPCREEHRQRAVIERFVARAIAKDESGLAKTIRDEAPRRATIFEKYAFIRELDLRVGQVPKEVLPEITTAHLDDLLEGEGRANPAEPLYPMGRLHLHSRLFTQKTAAALVDILKAAPADPAAARHVLTYLGRHFSDFLTAGNPSGENEERPEGWTPESAEKLCAALDALTGEAAADPRIPLAAGRVLEASGNLEGAISRYETARKICRAMKADHPGYKDAQTVLYRVAISKSKGPADAWMEGCVKDLLAMTSDGDGIQPWQYYDRSRNPIVQVASAAILAKDWEKFYAIASVANEKMLGGYWQIRQEVQGPLVKECAEATFKVLLRDAKDGPAFKRYAKFALYLLGDVGTLEALEKGAALAPDDIETLVMLADAAGRRTERDKAIQAYERLLKLLDKPVRISNVTHNRPLTLVRIAGHYAERVEKEKARETLRRIDLKDLDLDAPVALAIGHLYVKIDDGEAAIPAYLRVIELGGRAGANIGAIYEKKKDYYEAIRWYNRDIAQAAASDVNPNYKYSKRVESSEAGAVGRERLLGKVGRDFLLKYLFERKFEALAAAEDTTVRAAYEKLSGDGLDDREAGIEALRKIGAKATPLLSELVKGGDPEVQTRVKTLFLEWAEPR